MPYSLSDRIVPPDGITAMLKMKESSPGTRRSAWEYLSKRVEFRMNLQMTYDLRKVLKRA